MEVDKCKVSPTSVIVQWIKLLSNLISIHINRVPATLVPRLTFLSLTVSPRWDGHFHSTFIFSLFISLHHPLLIITDIIFYFLMLIYFWQRERERQSVSEGRAERERHTQNVKQAPGSELSAQSPKRDSNSWTAKSDAQQPTEPPRCPSHRYHHVPNSKKKKSVLVFIGFCEMEVVQRSLSPHSSSIPL